MERETFTPETFEITSAKIRGNELLLGWGTSALQPFKFTENPGLKEMAEEVVSDQSLFEIQTTATHGLTVVRK